MFEDSTFESLGKIRTRSRGWMIATSAFNGSILIALVLVPLLYPAALPRLMLTQFLEAPKPPAPAPKPEPVPKNAVLVQSQMSGNVLFGPRRIPTSLPTTDRPEILKPVNIADIEGMPGTSNDPFGSHTRPSIVRQQPQAPVRISGMVSEGLLLDKRLPVYPPIAKATGTQGTVVLEASISRAGTIENLRVVSGPQMLQQAAMDAVRAWRYRPYLLNGDPVEVETTIHVVFTLHN